MSENSFGDDLLDELDGESDNEVSNEFEYQASSLGSQSPQSTVSGSLVAQRSSTVREALVLGSSSDSSTSSTFFSSRHSSITNRSTASSTRANSSLLHDAPDVGFGDSSITFSRNSLESIITNSPVVSSMQSSSSSVSLPILRSRRYTSLPESPGSSEADMSVPSPISISSESTIAYIDIDSDHMEGSIDMESEIDDYDSDTLTEPFEGFELLEENGDHERDDNFDELLEPDEEYGVGTSDLDVSVDDEDEDSDLLESNDGDDNPEEPTEELPALPLLVQDVSINEEGENLTVTGEEEVKTSVSDHKLTSPPTCGVKRPAESDEVDEEDGQTCMICMDVWSNSGDHRLSSLKCGHLFGHSCIVRWLLLAKTKQQRRCPQCNLVASIKDVRILYAKKLMVLDTVEKDIIKKKLEATERERNKLELDLKKSELTTQLQARQLLDLQARLAASATVVRPDLAPGKSNAQSSSGTGNVNLVPEHTVEICKDGGCRVLAYKESLNLLVASQRSANALFSGYGISKMNSLDFRPTQFIFLHTKPIRDLAFHASDNDLLLSVSLDKCAKLMDISSNGVVQNFQTDTSLWSCCWDVDNSNIFFVGGQDGTVIQYDIRKTGSPVSRISRGPNVRSVTSLATMPSNPGGALPRGGFLACHLNSCWAYERMDSEYVGKELPMDGPFFSLRYDRGTDHILVSMRPSQHSVRARHVVCELDRLKATNSLTCNEIQSFEGSLTQSVLSRPCQMKIAGYGSVVASHQESSASIVIWSLANGTKVCNQPASDAILDTCPIQVNQKQYLGTVSDKTLRVYRVVPQ